VPRLTAAHEKVVAIDDANMGCSGKRQTAIFIGDENMQPKHLMILLILLTLTLPAAPAYAGGVVSTCDEACLLAALAGGGTVTFGCSGTITLTTTITIATDTTIDGSGQNVTISGNNTVRVFTVNSGSTLDLSRLTVADGYVSSPWGSGGGVLNSGTVNVSNSVFSGNRTDPYRGGGGGGIFNNSGATLTVNNSTFSGNSARGDGGGICNFSGTVTVSNSTFSNNGAGAEGAGGGINNYDGPLMVSNSTFSGNGANGGGGAIQTNAFDSTVIVSNSTFSGNNAWGSGGGLEVLSGAVTVYNSTFSGNSAVVGWAFPGGGISNSPNNLYSPVTLKNTIVANSPTGGNCSGTITDGGGNLSYPDTTCPGINRNPMLSSLASWGGPTQTMGLRAGSAALDAANGAICAASPVNNLDQRGITRPVGPYCDIGAYEGMLASIFLPTIMR
jgi:hypothetical protein